MKTPGDISHDLTALTQRECAALIVIWALVNISRHLAVQAKCYFDLENIFQITHLYFRKYTFAPPHVFYTLGYLLAAPALLSIPCIYSFSAIWRVILASYSLSYSSLLRLRFSTVSHHSTAWKVPRTMLARVSKFWGLRIAAGGKQHLVYKALHDTYGPIVRVGSYIVHKLFESFKLNLLSKPQDQTNCQLLTLKPSRLYSGGGWGGEAWGKGIVRTAKADH